MRLIGFIPIFVVTSAIEKQTNAHQLLTGR
jgi:hypothetical protein